MKNKHMNKDLSSMSRDESEQNIIELTTQVESQKQIDPGGCRSSSTCCSRNGSEYPVKRI